MITAHAQLSIRDTRDESPPDAPVALLIHGTPSHSGEFSALIDQLKSTYRCIAPDLTGFGQSQRPATWGYRFEDHTAVLRRVLKELELQPEVFIVHDVGGMVALPLIYEALESPRPPHCVVVLNSWAWDLAEDRAFRAGRWLLKSRFMRWLYLRWSFSARFMVPSAWGKHRPLTLELHRDHFLKQFPTPASRAGTWGFADDLCREGEYCTRLKQFLPRLDVTPTLVVWGMADRYVGKYHLQEWKRQLPHAKTLELDQVGHFPLLEAPELVIPPILQFIQEHSVPAARG